MKPVFTNLFTKIMIAVVSLTAFASCSDDDEPGTVSAQKYDIPMECNAKIEIGKVTVVNDEGTLNQIFEGYDVPKVDFGKSELILVKGECNSGISNIKTDCKIKGNKMIVNVEITRNGLTVMQKWTVGYIVPRNSDLQVKYNVKYLP